MFESRISAVGEVKNDPNLKPHRNLRHTPSLLGPMIWRVMQGNAWKDVANLNNVTRSQRHASMTTNLKNKKLDQLHCPSFATPCMEIRSGKPCRNEFKECKEIGTRLEHMTPQFAHT